MRVQVPPAAPMGGNAVRAVSLSSFRADTTTDTASTGSLRPPIPAQRGITSRLLEGAALSTCPRHDRRSASPAAALISHGGRCSGMTSRNIGHQYRPRAKAGRVTPRGPLTPGANTSFMCSFLFCIFFLFPPAVITARPVFAHDRQETDCHGQCEHWPRNDNEVRL